MSRILIIDDEPAFALMLRLHLCRLGGWPDAAVAGVSAPAAAQPHFSADNPAAWPEAVLVDWLLNNDDGMAYLEQLAADYRRTGRRAFLALMTAASGAEEQQLARRCAVIDAQLLAKPFTASRLQALLTAAGVTP
ncbi:MAG TPA: hypothetical protein PKM88_00870 [bacterium]|nr:hypothetical protein [bacterium]